MNPELRGRLHANSGEPLGIDGRPEAASAELGEKVVDTFVAACDLLLGDVPPTRALPTPDEDGTEGGWLDTVSAAYAAPDPGAAFLSQLFSPESSEA